MLALDRLNPILNEKNPQLLQYLESGLDEIRIGKIISAAGPNLPDDLHDLYK